VTRCRLTEERALSSRQLMLVHSKLLRWLARPLLPKGWTAGGLKTSGEVEARRASLHMLGDRLATLGFCSFLCKCVSSATLYLARESELYSTSGNFEAIVFLATTLTVQAIPAALTLLFLGRFHLSRGACGSGVLLQSLLPHDDVSVAVPSDCAAAARDNEQLAAVVARLQAENAQLRAQVAKS
jgi:hypothetical protein